MLSKLSRREQYFYKEVARMVSRINAGRSTVKSEVYRTKTPLRYHALLHKVMLNYETLSDIAAKSECSEEPEISSILVYEILSGNLRDTESRRKFKKMLGGRVLEEVESSVFIRLNTLRISREDVKEYEIKDTCVPNVFQLLDGGAKGKRSIADFYRDFELLKNLKIQNLSSCLPAFILNPPENATVIDATAAPGNKTTHLCSIMGNTGTIHAFERNGQRFAMLREQIEKYGATNTKVYNKDFLQVDPAEYPAEYVLVDPSCTGSGIHLNYKKDQARVDALHNVQAMLLNHAFKFSPQKVVYSTCSVHAEEGEDVVKEALEKNPGYEIEPIGDFWAERGHPGYSFSESVIRARPADGTVGFFVALFRKIAE